MISFKVKNAQLGKLQKYPEAFKRAQLIFDTQVLKDSNRYIPKDTGALENSGIIYSRLGTGHVGWNTPYARRLYYNPRYNFSTDKNPYARGLWFQYAKQNHIKEWKKVLANYIVKELGGNQ